MIRLRLLLAPALVLALTGCGGGEETAAVAEGACATPVAAGPDAGAAEVAATVPRPVAKRDARELEELTPEQADLVARLEAAQAALREGAGVAAGQQEAAHDQPAHEEPVHEEPVHDQPAHEEPVHDQPAHEEPVQAHGASDVVVVAVEAPEDDAPDGEPCAEEADPVAH